MKRIIILALCGALLQGSVQAQSKDPPVEPNGGLFIAAFVLSCVAFGGYIIFRVSKTLPKEDAVVTIVLEKSSDGRATWVPVFTNTVALHGHEPLDFFRDRMDDQYAFYRGRIVR